jgi:putative RecB family exonuclease
MTTTDLPTPLLGSLSPSRAGDFMTCPLLYRFRALDRLPERSTSEAVRGTVVHAVLERLFDLPPAERTPEVAAAMVEPEWTRLLEAEPELGELFPDGDAVAQWLASARPMLEAYFTLEDPQRLQPAERESLVEAVLDSGLRLRGFVDRLDVAPCGAVRVVDYKTGRIPGERHEGKALFQLKFYALVLWRTRGVVPRELRLLYLADREMLRYSPTEAELLAVERMLDALWAAIARATASGDFRARRSALCHWCDHQARCPEFGGTPPPMPDTLRRDARSPEALPSC